MKVVFCSQGEGGESGDANVHSNQIRWAWDQSPPEEEEVEMPVKHWTNVSAKSRMRGKAKRDTPKISKFISWFCWGAWYMFLIVHGSAIVIVSLVTLSSNELCVWIFLGDNIRHCTTDYFCNSGNSSPYRNCSLRIATLVCVCLRLLVKQPDIACA